MKLTERPVLLNINRALVALLLLGVWQAAVSLKLVQPLFLASPAETWNQLIRLGSGRGLSDVLDTLQVAAIGFVIGMVAGSLIGFALGLWPAASAITQPFISIFNTLPRIALAPLFVVWFGIGMASGVALVTSLVIFFALVNVLAGIQSVERNHVVLARLLGATRVEVTRKVVAPATLPWIAAAARLGLAYAIGGAVVSQMFLGQSGLGYLIAAGAGTFDVPLIFASLILIMVIAWVLDFAMGKVERRLFAWREPA